MASRSVNKVILIGNLGRDAETKFTPGGISVTKFSVGTNRRWKDQQSGEWKEEANWTDVVLWRGENVANYLAEGASRFMLRAVFSDSQPTTGIRMARKSGGPKWWPRK